MQLDVILFAWLQEFRWFAEVFDLHLLEFASAEGEIARRDFVAENFPDLRDTERQLATRRLQDVEEIDEDALRCFRAQVGNVLLAFDGADYCFEHLVEVARLGEIGRATIRTLFVFEMIGSMPCFAIPAIYQRISKGRFVT